MGRLTKYRRREDTLVTAVQLDLDTEGLTYRKWGGEQTARAGDWLVNNDGSTYTIDRDVFERTYSKQSPGVYRKTNTVWARQAETDGKIKTTSGHTDYEAGDMIVFNDEEEEDGWAMAAEEFESLYELAD